jgi:hypothetical protein
VEWSSSHEPSVRSQIFDAGTDTAHACVYVLCPAQTDISPGVHHLLLFLHSYLLVTADRRADSRLLHDPIRIAIDADRPVQHSLGTHVSSVVRSCARYICRKSRWSNTSRLVNPGQKTYEDIWVVMAGVKDDGCNKPGKSYDFQARRRAGCCT